MSDNPLRDARRELIQAEWIPADVYAKKYGVCIRTLRKWIRERSIEFYRKGRVLRLKDQIPPAA